ncbi:MAG TPA: (deoxy)nucleoside triphosphate pyrophosphohydrolase [Jatrophihabitantaceae bacterium]|jgi:8-oxo-dGTP diphosphatase
MSVRVVVGAVIVRDGRVLAARRSAPPELAGGWEFPGGKVEPGESEPSALMRECREELGVRVTVGELLGSAPLSRGFVLHVYLAALVAGEPRPLQDHDELRWLAADELDSVDWLPAERPALAAVAALLAAA